MGFHFFYPSVQPSIAGKKKFAYKNGFDHVKQSKEELQAKLTKTGTEDSEGWRKSGRCVVSV